jgi:hypothetical protein
MKGEERKGYFKNDVMIRLTIRFLKNWYPLRNASQYAEKAGTANF